MKSENNQTQKKSQLQDPKLLALIGLLAVTALVLMAQRGNDSARAHSTTGSHPRSVVRKSAEDPVYLFSKLREAPPIFQSEKRNIFDFYQPPPPPPPARKPQVVEKKPDPVCGDQICQDNEDYQNCPSDCQPPPPPDIPLRYIGYLSEDGGAVAFLTDGKEVYMGRENDIIANKYRILKITDQNVELGYLNLNQSKSIPFQGNGQS